MQKTPIVLAALCVAVLVLSSGASAARSAAAPEIREEGDKLVMENDHVAVWFQGKKPMLKVFPAGNESLAYGYKFTSVVEYRDLDANDAPNGSEVFARLNLEQASAWEVERVETEDLVVLNLTLRAPVKLNQGILPERDVELPESEAEVSLVFTLRTQDHVLPLDGENVTVPRTSVKYDFVVHEWPFVDAETHRLALQSHVQGDLVIDEAQAIGAATVATNDTELGTLTWLPTANGTLANGSETQVPVHAHIEETENGTLLSFTYDAANLARLVHDPTIGVLTTETLVDADDTLGGLRNTVPATGLLATGLAAAAALVTTRRSRSPRGR